ncbi:hypothetical protein [Microbispora sp. NBC_01389]|uniref:hypothetical protein n=1 Tax=Microbispora sp. NBC_01389 TaxID=2903584 RepID=UPI003247CAD9
MHSPDGSTNVFVDNRPGDKVFRFSPGVNTWWQVRGSITGPGSTYIYRNAGQCSGLQAGGEGPRGSAR